MQALRTHSRPVSPFHALLLGAVLLAATGSATSASAATTPDEPIAVSPGMPADRLEVTPTAAGRCPTFSWGAGNWGADSRNASSTLATDRRYELAVYRLAEDPDGEAVQVLHTEVSGLATSFTPSLDACLDGGAEYAWSIRAVTSRAAGAWSQPLVFAAPRPTDEIDLATALAVVEEHLARQHLATQGPSVPKQSRTAPSSKNVVETTAPQRGSGATLRVTGQVLADAFRGDGSALGNLDPASLQSGTAAIDITGSATGLSATLAVARGGTGATDAAAARSQLGAASVADLDALAGDVAALAGESTITECPEPFDAIERVFPEEDGVQQRICATERLQLTNPIVSVRELIEDEVGAICSVLATMNMQRVDRRMQEQALRDLEEFHIRDALTDLEVLLENTLGGMFGAIDDLFNATDNAMEGAVNPMFNLIDREACPGDCWPTNPVNMPNLNLDNSLRNLDFDPFADIVDIAEAVIENPDLLSLMCTDPELRDEYVDNLIGIMPSELGGGPSPAADPSQILTVTYQQAETACATRGGHVCSTPELFQLSGVGAPASIGCQAGDFVQGGELIATPFSQTRNLFETSWPPIRIDLSPLLAWPPGPPVSISWPIKPSGGYRCCLSTVDF